eukprot:15154546-Alexandrium_andersonii.AAC.1
MLAAAAAAAAAAVARSVHCLGLSGPGPRLGPTLGRPARRRALRGAESVVACGRRRALRRSGVSLAAGA